MPGASPQNHDASGWGSSKMGTLSRWHHEQAPHLSQLFNRSARLAACLPVHGPWARKPRGCRSGWMSEHNRNRRGEGVTAMAGV